MAKSKTPAPKKKVVKAAAKATKVVKAAAKPAKVVKTAAKAAKPKRSKETREKIAKARMKPVQQLSLKGKSIKTFPSLKEAAEATGTHPSNIIKVCKGELNSAGGFSWKYKTK